MRTEGRRTGRRKRAAGRGIICGTDFSERAGHAISVAEAISKRLKDTLTLVHVIELPSLRQSREEVARLLTTSRAADLREDAERIRARGIDVDERTVVGRPDEALVDIAAREQPRLIVVSSVSRRGAERWMIGSVSERTAKRAPIPTLVVRDSAPLVAWARGERALKVFACFDFTATAEAALRLIRDLRAIGPCEVTVGFVFWPPEQSARLGPDTFVAPGHRATSATAIIERDLIARATELLGQKPAGVQVEAGWGRADARLAEMARKSGADLAVIGSRQCHGFERLWQTSMSRGLLQEAPMSVAIVPMPTGESCEIAETPLPVVKRVLVTTDFSDLANAAIPHACSLLGRGGTIHLLHVAPTSRARSAGRKHLQSLRKLIPPAAAVAGIDSVVEVTHRRDVATAICQAAERIGADVICLGTHGRSGMSKAILGSVAQEVLSRSRRPLLLIRPRPC